MEDKAVKILLIEDTSSDADLVQEMLDKSMAPSFSFDLVHADRLSTGLKLLAKGGIDIVLLDLFLPESRGIGTLHKVHAKAAQVPIIALTRLDDELTGLKAVQEGAQDYLIKGRINGDLLVRAIQYAIERNQVKQELRDAYDKLRHSSQLIQTEKMVTAGTLVAGVAHEMNNPMTALLQFTEYCLKHTAEDARIYPVLNDMVRETNRCIDIVQNLLTFSHMEREGKEGYKEESLATVIDRVLRLISYRIEKERVSLKRHIAEGVPEIWMKPSMMQQVFLNLIINALDAVQESDGKEIRIEALCEGGSVLVTVADNGCGMGPEQLKQIFDPFFTTKPVGQGTGLGLSIIQSIIEIHKGKISCESNPGVGTTFRLLLPVERRGGK